MARKYSCPFLKEDACIPHSSLRIKAFIYTSPSNLHGNHLGNNSFLTTALSLHPSRYNEPQKRIQQHLRVLYTEVSPMRPQVIPSVWKLTVSRSSGGSGMLEPYIYDTRSVQERQYQPGPAPTPEQQRQNMQRRLNNFDQKFYGNGTNPPTRR